MKESEKKLLIFEIVGSLILILNIFVKNIFNDYTIILFLIGMLALSYYMLGFEVNKKVNRKEITRTVAIYTTAFLVMLYGLGIFIGFTKSPYSTNWLILLKNIFPVTIQIVTTELLRYNILKKSGSTPKVRLMVNILTTLLDASLAVHLYDVKTFMGAEEMIMSVIIPMSSKNIMLTKFSASYGYEPCWTYALIIGLYQYLLPIQPNLNIYLQSVLLFLIPVIMETIINNMFEKKEKEDIRDKNSLKNKVITVITYVIMAIIIILNSNAFRFATTAVGSGSMEPTIRVGDAILIDKSYSQHLDKLKVGDILVFRVDDSVYTHRIMDIDVTGNKYQFTTKGDNPTNSVDDWIVTNEDVVGVVKGRIPLIGYPTVWLNQLMRGRGI